MYVLYWWCLGTRGVMNDVLQYLCSLLIELQTSHPIQAQHVYPALPDHTHSIQDHRGLQVHLQTDHTDTTMLWLKHRGKHTLQNECTDLDTLLNHSHCGSLSTTQIKVVRFSQVQGHPVHHQRHMSVSVFSHSI